MLFSIQAIENKTSCPAPNILPNNWSVGSQVSLGLCNEDAIPRAFYLQSAAVITQLNPTQNNLRTTRSKKTKPKQKIYFDSTILQFVGPKVLPPPPKSQLDFLRYKETWLGWMRISIDISSMMRCTVALSSLSGWKTASLWKAEK